MADMSKFSTPGQKNHRAQWIVDTVRNNQFEVWKLFEWILDDGNFTQGQLVLADMHKGDRDALLQPNGILTDAQIELLK